MPVVSWSFSKVQQFGIHGLRWALAGVAGACACLAMAQQLPAAGEVMFAAGQITLQREGAAAPVLTKGTQLQQGDKLTTSETGYVYVRMADGALLVVRPGSSLQIDRWQYEPAQPEQSQIKYTLDHGVARYVSGKGSQAAKDKFRFNTPLAAIGVRGTDFTVLASHQVTQVSVASGGVVVGALGHGCAAEALGPCEGDRVAELFADSVNKMVEVSLHDRQPRLVEVPGGQGPNQVQPPAVDEPQARQETEEAEDPATKPPMLTDDTREVAVTDSVKLLPMPPASSFVTWGRWGQLSPGRDDASVVREVLDGRTLVAMNKYYVLARNGDAVMELPGTGVGQFKLVSHQGVMVEPRTQALLETTATNGVLSIDFGGRRFSTSVDLAAGDYRARIQANGSIEANGLMVSDRFVSPTVVNGVVGGLSGSEASYLYRRSPEVGLFEVSGVTYWTRNAPGVTSWTK